MTGRSYETLSLLTDLGSADESVGVLRSIVRDAAPHTTVTDLGHEVRPGDVRSASVMLARAVNYLPAGVVAVCVDAGITSERRCVAIQVAGGEGVLVGPDNGVLAPAVAMLGGAEAAVVLDAEEHHLQTPGARWPARDVIVPAAAALCAGTPLADLGTPVDPDELMPGVVPLSRQDGQTLVADVLWVDRSGACQTNLDPAELDPFGEHMSVSVGLPGAGAEPTTRLARRVGIGGVPVAELKAGALGLIVDAAGMISLIAAGRSAAAELGVVAGDQIVVSPLDPADRPQPGATTRVDLRIKGGPIDPRR